MVNYFSLDKTLLLIKLSSIAQSVEHAAVNRAVVGSSPTRGVGSMVTSMISGPMVKRLRHRPFTAVTRVRISLGSLETKNH